MARRVGSTRLPKVLQPGGNFLRARGIRAGRSGAAHPTEPEPAGRPQRLEMLCDRGRVDPERCGNLLGRSAGISTMRRRSDRSGDERFASRTTGLARAVLRPVSGMHEILQGKEYRDDAGTLGLVLASREASRARAPESTNTMNTIIHTIGRPERRRTEAPRLQADYRAMVYSVAGERLTCRVMHRQDPTAAAEHRIGLAASLPFTPVVLLQEPRGFLGALSDAYGVDLADGFERVVCIEQLDTTRPFAADPTYRRAVIEHLGRRTLGAAGFVAIHPAQGMWRRNRGGLPMPPPANQTLALCHLFGSCGFAQLCDDRVLDRPVPVFLHPWTRKQGLLTPVRLPEEPFSRCMCVRRLRPGRMVLFDRT